MTSNRIRVCGHVSRDDLNELIRVAELVAFPSRYEGFGLPVLEAQLAGTPVAVSTSTALPEVAGSEALLIGPDDVDGWASAMTTPLTGADRERHLAAGRQNARRYSPQRTAEQLLGAYAQLTE